LCATLSRKGIIIDNPDSRVLVYFPNLSITYTLDCGTTLIDKNRNSIERKKTKIKKT
jgi:hypothetical protein